MTAIIVGIIFYFQSLSPEELSRQSSFFSNLILFSIICGFILMALRKKVNVYEAFIDGAKGGFNIAIKIIPYLVAILVAIGVFRASGALDYLEQGMSWFFGLFLENTEFTKGLPTAFMKPLSGSGARGMMLESWSTYGVDSFVGKLTATLQGATDTTFYIIAVYFGAVGIKKTRYAVKAGLLADFAGIVAGIIVATIWFGGDPEVVYNTPEIVVNEFGEAWVNGDHSEMNQLLSDNCVLYDQAHDTLYSNGIEIIDKYFDNDREPAYREVKKVSVVNADKSNGDLYFKIYYHNNTTPYKQTYEVFVDKGKIQYFKYLGEF